MQNELCGRGISDWFNMLRNIQSVVCMGQESDAGNIGMGIACKITTWASNGSHQHANSQSNVINRRFSARFIRTIANSSLYQP